MAWNIMLADSEVAYVYHEKDKTWTRWAKKSNDSRAYITQPGITALPLDAQTHLFKATVKLALDAGASYLPIGADKQILRVTLSIGGVEDLRDCSLQDLVDHPVVLHGYTLRLEQGKIELVSAGPPELGCVKCPSCGEEVYGFLPKEG